MSKKFELTAEVKEFFGIKLFRIKALVAFGGVDEGELGGWVEKEGNLDQRGDAWVYGDARVYGDAWVSDDARVYDDAHYLTISPIGSERGVLTAFRQKDNSIMVRRGCFSGTIDEFESAVDERHGDSKYGDVYRALIPVIKLQLDEVEVSNEQ